MVIRKACWILMKIFFILLLTKFIFDDLVVEKNFADVKYFAIVILKNPIPFRLRQ